MSSSRRSQIFPPVSVGDKDVAVFFAHSAREQLAQARHSISPQQIQAQSAFSVLQTQRINIWKKRLRKILQAKNLSLIFGGVLVLIGFGNAGYIHAKASLAQSLIARAYQKSAVTHQPQRPWPWADTWPVAKISVPRLRIEQYALSGASGRNLAFGPALSPAAAMPGELGNVVISGHRDTHFQFLQYVQIGDRVWLETTQGKFAYQIERSDVVDTRSTRIATQTDSAHLLLVTCYPFNAIAPGGPLRYVLQGKLVATNTTSTSAIGDI